MPIAVWFKANKMIILMTVVTITMNTGATGFYTNPLFSRFESRGVNGNSNRLPREIHNDQIPSKLFERASDKGEKFYDETSPDELKRRIAQMNNPYNDLFGWPIDKPTPDGVHIILFNPGSVEEGVHTIEYPQKSGNNVILAFESKKECERFSEMLRQQHFFEPMPQAMKMSNLETYCERLGVFFQVVPEGTKIVPPPKSVDKLGHDPFLKQNKAELDIIFALEDTEFNEDGAVHIEELVGSWE